MRILVTTILAFAAIAPIHAVVASPPLKAILAQYDRVGAAPGDAAPGGGLTLPDQSTAAIARRQSALDAVKHGSSAF